MDEGGPADDLTPYQKEYQEGCFSMVGEILELKNRIEELESKLFWGF